MGIYECTCDLCNEKYYWSSYDLGNEFTCAQCLQCESCRTIICLKHKEELSSYGFIASKSRGILSRCPCYPSYVEELKHCVYSMVLFELPSDLSWIVVSFMHFPIAKWNILYSNSVNYPSVQLFLTYVEEPTVHLTSLKNLRFL